MGRRPRQVVRQGHTVDELAHQVRRAIRLADFVNRDDGRMPQLGDAPGLTQEAFLIVFVRQASGAGNFYGDGSVELAIARLVNRPEGAAPHSRQQFEFPDSPDARRRGDRRMRSEIDAQVRPARRTQHAVGRVRIRHLDRSLAVRADEIHGGFPKRRAGQVLQKSKCGPLRTSLMLPAGSGKKEADEACAATRIDAHHRATVGIITVKVLHLSA